MELKDRVYRMVVGIVQFRVLVNNKDPSSDIDGSRDMRMIQWMCGNMRFDKIRIEVIKERVRVVSIEDKIKDTILR